MKILFVLPFLLLTACLPKVEMSCTESVPSIAWTSLNQTQLQADMLAIDTYLDALPVPVTAIEDPSGLRYIITTAGTGGVPSCLENNISVKYEGRFLNTGAVFDSSTTPVSFPLGNLILGWQIGFLKLNKGSKATLYIPSGLAYGVTGLVNQNTGAVIIPPNSNLIFDVELVSF
jgi:FKBP-type peptidyl-prolyl cis-trans isomerase FkpA